MNQPPQWGPPPGAPGWGPPQGYQPPQQPRSKSSPTLILLGIMCGLCCLGAAISEPKNSSPQATPVAARSTPAASAPASNGAPAVAPLPDASTATPDAGPPSPAAILRAANEHVAAPLPVNVLDYNSQLADDLSAVNAIQEPERTTMRREIRTTVRAIERRRREIRGPVREAAEALALRTICGDSPSVGGWDGEVPGAEAYMRRTAHDPGSIDVENCTQPVLTRRNCWVTECIVRGRNAFGARVANTVRFSVGRAGILGAETL